MFVDLGASGGEHLQGGGGDAGDVGLPAANRFPTNPQCRGELAAEDSDVAEYIAALEQREPEEDLPESSGEAIAKEFERYLRRRDDGPAR